MDVKSIKVKKNYRFTIPHEIRKEILIETGDVLQMMVNKKREVIICKVKKTAVEESFGIWAKEKSGIDYVNKIRDEAEERLKERCFE